MTAATIKLSVWNRALAHVGHQPLAATTDVVPAVALLTLFYTPCRQDLLGMTAWPFARKTAIPEGITPQDDGWAATYPYPSDALWITNIYPEDYGQATLSAPTEIPWERTENGISCDYTESVVIRYVKDEDDETLWPAEFADLMSWCLAARIAHSVTANLNVVSMVENQYRSRLQLYLNRSSREDKRRREFGTALIDARNG
jgi:hypothetical protein